MFQRSYHNRDKVSLILNIWLKILVRPRKEEIEEAYYTLYLPTQQWAD